MVKCLKTGVSFQTKKSVLPESKHNMCLQPKIVDLAGDGLLYKSPVIEK